MLQYELQRTDGILILKPSGPLESADFEKLVREVDPYIKFVKNHHRKVKKLAAVTDSGFLSIMPHVAKHFARAEIRHFAYKDKDAALHWLKAA